MKARITVLLALALPASAGSAGLDPAETALPQQTQEQGAARQVPTNKVPVVLIEGSERSSIAFIGQIDEPVRSTGIDRLDEIVRQYAAADKPVIVAIDATRLRERKYLTSPTNKQIKKQIDIEKKANPAYKRAQDELREAEKTLREAESSDRDAQRQAIELAKDPNLNRWGVLGAGALAFAGKSSLSSARAEVEQAKAKLKETEPELEQPIYSTVTAPAASLVEEKSGEITALVIDVRSQSARTVRIPVREETRSEYVYDPSVGDMPMPTGKSVSASHQVAIDQIMRESATSPNMALADAVSALKADRETFIAATAELDKQRSETTSRTLAQLTGTSKPDSKEKPREVVAAKAAPVDSAASTGASAAGSTTASGGASESAGGSGSASASSGASGPCPKDISALAKKVKPTGLPRIDKPVARMAATDIIAAMREATKQGYTAASAVQASQETAKAMKKTAAEAARAAGQAFGRPGYSDDEFLAQLNEGTLAPKDCEGTSSASVCTAITMRTEAIANEMIADAMACHQKKGTWPK